MSKKTGVNVSVLPPREVLNDQIASVLELLTFRKNSNADNVEENQKRLEENEHRFWKRAAELSDQLFGQMKSKLGEKRLIIIPDGKLKHLPISALPSPGSDPAKYEPLILTNEIVYAPSASMLNLILKQGRSNAGTPEKDFLIFSDPVFSRFDSRVDGPGEISDLESGDAEDGSGRDAPIRNIDSLPRLPSTRDESQLILNTFGSRNSSELFGFAANRVRFLASEAANYKVLHFATHGILNESEPELSGIVLSRYDEQGKKIDGFVRLHDIYGLKLSSDLAVLSACDTAKGEEIKGEGLMSLTNAFLQVGVRSVISSHWKVDDYASQKLMSSFYRILAKEKVAPSEALRKAQIEMLQDPNYKSPFYWSAFTSHGDFQNRPDLQTNFDYTRYWAVLALVFLVFGIGLSVRKYRTSQITG